MLTSLSRSIRRFAEAMLGRPASVEEDRPAAPAEARPDSAIGEPFIAGSGARIYSMDVFRRERSAPPQPRQPVRPRAA